MDPNQQPIDLPPPSPEEQPPVTPGQPLMPPEQPQTQYRQQVPQPLMPQPIQQQQVPQPQLQPQPQPLMPAARPVAPEWQEPPVIDMEVKPNPVRKGLLITLIIILVAAAGAGAAWWFTQHHPAKQDTTTQKTKTPTVKTQGLVLDTKKKYGNKYADNILPVGDGRYSTDKATKGFIYTCSDYAKNLAANQGGAGTRGPWFTNNNTSYDISKKAHVQGSIMWQAAFTNKVSGSTRTITTNDLPSHPTGIFPIATNDPAYAFDTNPGAIAAQTLTYALSAKPAYGSPSCMGGEVGVMLTGIALFNGFDAGGRDAGAWEVQDTCDGHPQKEGEYHYHTLSSCIKDTSVQTVIGYALDGFPITGPKVAVNSILTTDDLDECHGITSQILVDKKLVTSYHYVMTQDFPYSVSCFRGKAIAPPTMQASPDKIQPQQQ
jgi:hypothetical protein